MRGGSARQGGTGPLSLWAGCWDSHPTGPALPQLTMSIVEAVTGPHPHVASGYLIRLGPGEQTFRKEVPRPLLSRVRSRTVFIRAPALRSAAK